MRILVVTNLYPSEAQPAFGTFVAAHVDAIRRHGVDVHVEAITDARVHERRVAKYGSLFLRALLAAANARVKGRRFDVVEAHLALPTGVVAVLAARLAGAPLVLFAHGSDVSRMPWGSRIAHVVARWTFRRADLVIANSAFTQALALRLGPLKRTPLIVSPGVALPPVVSQLAERRGVMYVGRLTEAKGVRVLLAAFASIDAPESFDLTYVGGGPDFALLQAAAARRNLRVRLLGPLAPAEVRSLLAQAAVVAVPSVEPEGLGLSALEGMAHGALVVGTTVGGLAETIQDGLNAIAAEPGSVASLASALRRAIEVARTPAGAAIAVAGRHTAMRHDEEQATVATLRAYAALAAERAASGPAGRTGQRR